VNRRLPELGEAIGQGWGTTGNVMLPAEDVTG
jgi:hypothetical protein